MPRPEIVTLPDADALAWEAASRVTATAREAVQARGQFTLALSGGSTPLRLFALLAMAEWQVRMPWERTHLFWADERPVPPDDPESNYGAARTALLSRLMLPDEQVHRWFGEATDLNTEAARYGALLQTYCQKDARGMPRLDLILLGMGPDGHTASLFPHSPALTVTDAPAAANPVAKLNATRLTLTHPAIDAARAVIFLVAGADKAETLARVINGPAAPEELPSRAVHPHDGSLLWLADQAAAGRLE